MPFKVFTQRDLDRIEPFARLPEAMRFEMRVVSTVLPFGEQVCDRRTDRLEQCASRTRSPAHLPQRGMLPPQHYDRIAAALLAQGADKAQVEAAASEVRNELNPHPADQMEMNMPRDEAGRRLDGIQRNVPRNGALFPARADLPQLLHLLFPLAQFIGDKDLKIASSEAETLHDYICAPTPR